MNDLNLDWTNFDKAVDAHIKNISVVAVDMGLVPVTANVTESPIFVNRDGSFDPDGAAAYYE